MANILEAIHRIVSSPIIEVKTFYQSKNRANSVGEALEKYVKDIFANTFNEENEAVRDGIYSEIFSYLGNQNNPPDIILKGGDAIETKKVQSPTSALALNSSYPKAKLYADSPMITAACRDCEKWSEKDIAYVVGHTSDTALKYLWIVYGDCFSASREVYERIKKTISDGVNNIPDVEFTASNELGKVKKVDPLGITDLRIRGMWHIENPHKVFKYLNCIDDTAKFQLIVLMRTEKFNSFPKAEREKLSKLNKANYKIVDVDFKNPDNPAQSLKGKLITYKVK